MRTGENLSEETAIALLKYNLRRGFYHEVIQKGASFLKSSMINDPSVMFWKACATGLMGMHQQAIRDLQSMRQGHRNLDYAIISAIKWFHEQSEMFDQEELDSLELMLNATTDCVSAEGSILASNFYLYVGNFSECSRCLKMNVLNKGEYGSTVSIDMLVTRLWLGIKLPEEFDTCNCSDFTSLQPNSCRSIDYLMAQANYLDHNGDIAPAVECLNKVIGSEPSFYPALIEKAKMLLRLRHFHRAEKSAHRALKDSGGHIEALRILTLVKYVSNGDRHKAAEKLKQLVDDSTKNMDAKFCYQTARAFAHLCNNDTSTLELTLPLISRACEIDPCNSEFRSELAYQHYLLGNHVDSITEYQCASSLDQSNLEALRGIIFCQISKGELEDAKQQFEFLSLMQEEKLRDMKEVFIDIVLESDNNLKEMKLLILLDNATDHVASLDIKKEDIVNTYASFELPFVAQISTFILNRTKRMSLSTTGHDKCAGEEVRKKYLKMLHMVVEWCPADLDSWAAIAKSMIEKCQYESASNTLLDCLSIHKQSSVPHLLMAQLQIVQKNIEAAQQSLEQALSLDFAVQKHAIYRLVKSIVLMEKKDFKEAQYLLEKAVQTPEISEGINLDCITNTFDRASCYVELGRTLMELKSMDEARTLLLLAKRKFDKTDQSFRILKSTSDMYLEMNDIERALKVFDDTREDSPMFAVAETAKAEIHLNRLEDKSTFIQCHMGIADKEKTSHSYENLGEAFMRIHLPGQAVKAYEKALNLDPNNESLVGKIGKALIINHDFCTAKQHYERIIQISPDSTFVNLELAKLYTNLRDFDKAVEILTRILDRNIGETNNPHQLSDRIEMLLEIARAFQLSGKHDKTKASLIEAEKIQLKIYSKQSPTISHKKVEINIISNKILKDLAICFEKEESFYSAEKLYIKALDIIRDDETTLSSLSKVLLRQEKLNECRFYCDILLRLQPRSEDATIIMGDFLIAQTKLDEAVKRYMTFLATNSNSYVILINCILIQQRLGRIDDAIQVLDQVANENPRSLVHAGFNVAKGVYLRCVGDNSTALQHFNQARYDQEWSTRALENMIEIYLNIDDVDFWTSRRIDQGISSNVYNEPLQSSEILLNELVGSTNDIHKAHTLRGYMNLLSSFETGKVEDALKIFLKILEVNKEYIPALLGLAVSYAIDGGNSSSKYRNTLKRIAKIPYKSRLWKEFERSYLLLALTYVERGKNDLAQDLCQRCLHYNKSCSKAWEILAVIMENDQQLKDAVLCYEKCWASQGGGNGFEVEREKKALINRDDTSNASSSLSIYSSRMPSYASPAVGYKLALYYLKTKRNVEAIDICSFVLKQNPDYPSMKENILEKCMISLRP